MVKSGGQLHVCSRHQNMAWGNIKIDILGGMNSKWVLINNSAVDSIVFFQTLVVCQKYFTAVCLTVNIYKKHFLSESGKTCSDVYTGSGFTYSTLLGSNRIN